MVDVTVLSYDGCYSVKLWWMCIVLSHYGCYGLELWCVFYNVKL